MEEQQSAPVAAKPLWRRIVDFPLVAMVMAVAIFILAQRGAYCYLVKLLPPMDRAANSSPFKR